MGSFDHNRNSRYLMKTLNTMRENGEFCDLIFELNNSKFSAHRLIMAVWSPPMKNLLQLQSACTQHVRLAYDKPEVFQKFITFLYTGVLPEQVWNIPAVLLLAATFQINLLTEMCNEHLKTSITADNVISVYHLAIKFKLTDLEKHCIEFLCHHLSEITQKQELRDLTPTQINVLLGSEHITKREPEIKLCMIISWLAEDISNREQFLVLLLGHIDWSVMAKDFLVEIMNTDNFFTANPSSLYLLLQTLHSTSFSLGLYESNFLSLRQQYNYLLNSVINNSIVLGSDKPKHFQPLSFSLVSSPTEEQNVSDQNIDADKIMGIKNEQVTDFDLSANYDSEYSDMKQNHVSSYINIPVLRLNSSKNMSDHNTSSQYILSQNTEKRIIPEESVIASVPSTTFEGSMRRKCLKPHKITKDTHATKNRAQKMNKNKKKTNVSKQHNTRGRPRSNASELSFVDKEIPTDHLKNEEDTRRILLKTTASGRKESVRNKNTKQQLPVEIVQETVLNDESSGHQGKQNTNVKKDVSLIGRKKLLQPTSSRSSRKSRGRNKKSDRRKKINQVSSRKKIMKKKNTQLQEHKCCECEFTTYNRLMLEKHQKQVHEGNCLFCCSLCSFKSKWSKEFYGHLKQSHFPGPPFHCDEEECEYSTDKFQVLISHRKQHSDQRPFACDICLTAFKSKNNLYQHFKIHSDEKKFECQECHRCFKLKNTLEQHMVTHSDLRPYLCDLCGFSTKFQSHLISHKRIHTGDVFRCNFPSCTYSTPKKSQLKSHMRSHLGIRRHVCSTCRKAFIEKSHLIRHERTHSLERAHICNECNYSSTRADKLREHIHKHHSEEALRVKAIASNSKKLDALEKGNMKKTHKARNQRESGTELLSPNTENHIEVVVIKSSANHPRQSNLAVLETILPNITGSDVNARLMQSFPFLSQHVAPSTVSIPIIAPTIESAVSSGFKGAAKLERELSSAEELTKGLHIPDITAVIETAFEYQMQTTITEASVDSSLGNHTIISCSSAAGDKAEVAGEIINQHYQENTNITVPSYSLAMDSSIHFSKPSQFQQTAFTSQQSLQASHGPHHQITQPNATSSIVNQQYYHSQHHHLEQQHRDQQQQQEMQQLEHLSDVGNYLY